LSVVGEFIRTARKLPAAIAKSLRQQPKPKQQANHHPKRSAMMPALLCSHT
jgi:hypothetical protein